MPSGAYQPFRPARRPGGKPSRKPKYRLLVHRRYGQLWESLATRVGETNAQQFYDHVTTTPGEPPKVGSSTILRGRAGTPSEEGFSRRIHYEITGAGRIDYEYNDAYRVDATGDPHPIVRILTIDLSSH